MSAATIIEFGILVVFFFYLRKWFLQGLRGTYKGPNTTTFWNRPRRLFPFGLLAAFVALLLILVGSIVGEATHHPNIITVALILLVVPGAFLVLGLESLLSKARKLRRRGGR